MGARLRRAGLRGRGRARRMGVGRRRCRRRDRRADRGVGAVPGPRRGRRARRARRGAAGGGSPTWHARDVVIERAGWPGAPVRLVSPCPTRHRPRVAGGGRAHPPRTRARAAGRSSTWSTAPDEEPWKRSLLTSPLIRHLRDHERTRGLRAQHHRAGTAAGLSPLPVAGPVRALRGAPSPRSTTGVLRVRRCGAVRPAVCLECGAVGVRQPAPGVSRLARGDRGGRRPSGGDGHRRRHATRRPTPVSTSAPRPCCTGCRRPTSSPSSTSTARLLAPALPSERAGDGAARPRGPAGRATATWRPDPRADVPASARGDPRRARRRPGTARRTRRASRRALGLPPYGALAAMSGVGSDEFVAGLAGVEVAGSDAHYVVRADDWTALGTALLDATRPSGSRLRIAVDPPDV